MDAKLKWWQAILFLIWFIIRIPWLFLKMVWGLIAPDERGQR